jgi:membrane protein
VVSFIVLLFSAGGVFGELQDSMNAVWEVKPKPNRGWMDIVKQRFFSLALVLGTGFLLLVSLVINTLLASIVSSLGIGWFWSVVNFVVSLAVIIGLFTMLFKYLPDAKVPWKPAFLGGCVSAVLFTIGRYLLAWYLGRGSTTSVYGAAGSLAALLIWTYYSGLILFYGAEFTQALTQSQQRVDPKENAVKAPAADLERSELVRPSVPIVINPPRQTRRRPLIAGAIGLATGAVLGGLGTWLAERQIENSTPSWKRRPLAQRKNRIQEARACIRSLVEANPLLRTLDVEKALKHLER